MNPGASKPRRLPTPAISLADFEDACIDAREFDHAAHVYVAWQLLAEVPVPEAIARYASALQRLTRKLGVPGKYHETITGFFILLVAERRQACPARDWDRFAAANADLLRDPAALLAQFYSPARLGSDTARWTFLLPDLAPSQGAGTTL